MNVTSFCFPSDTNAVTLTSLSGFIQCSLGEQVWDMYERIARLHIDVTSACNRQASGVFCYFMLFFDAKAGTCMQGVSQAFTGPRD